MLVLALLSLSSLQCLLEGSLLLLGSLVVGISVGLVVVNGLQILDLGLPDTAEGCGRVLGNLGPGGLRAEKLDACGLGGELSGDGGTALAALSENVLSNQGARVEDCFPID